MGTNVFASFFSSPYGLATVLGIVFILVTQSALRDLVRKLTLTIQNKRVTVSTQQAQSENDVVQTEEYTKVAKTLADIDIHSSAELEEFLGEVYETVIGQHEQLEEAETATKALLELKQTYEFAYLNLFLVERSKEALLEWYHQGPMTKELFVASLEELDSPKEKESIFSALVANGLLDEAHAVYSVSERGQQFLEYIDYI